MQQVIDFFRLRPVFTQFMLRVLWYMYLAGVILNVFTWVNLSISSAASHSRWFIRFDRCIQCTNDGYAHVV